ncbi:MAG: hypothetical protein FWE99_04850 [Bacteroidales bacterium]|nr:hypothetical protein [Bacteroidales bacterium]
MKKILILGIALSFGLSSCGFFDFGPVPEPFDYAYIQAIEKTATGDVLLCTPVVMPVPGDYDPATVTDGVNASGKAISFAWASKETKAVYIKSSLNNWTLKDMQVLKGGAPLPAGQVKFAPAGADYPTSVTINDGTKDIFKLVWPGRTITVWDVYTFETPQFSGDIKIEKLAEPTALTAETYIFHVKGYGAFTLDYFPSPLYTGFKVNIAAQTTAEANAITLAANTTKLTADVAKFDAAVSSPVERDYVGTASNGFGSTWRNVWTLPTSGGIGFTNLDVFTWEIGTAVPGIRISSGGVLQIDKSIIPIGYATVTLKATMKVGTVAATTATQVKEVVVNIGTNFKQAWAAFDALPIDWKPPYPSGAVNNTWRGTGLILPTNPAIPHGATLAWTINPSLTGTRIQNHELQIQKSNIISGTALNVRGTMTIGNVVARKEYPVIIGN